MSTRHRIRSTAEELLRLGIVPKDRRTYFWEQCGHIHFGYAEQYRGRDFKLTREVPQEVRERGEAAIRTHAEAEVAAWRQEQRSKADRFDAFAEHPNISVTTVHRGVTLKGRITSVVNNTLRVQLEEPHTGEARVEYGFASALGGYHIFAKGDVPQLSNDALRSARRLLVEISCEQQHREEHRDTIALAERLNQRAG
ncbi:hypothetical protein HY634_03035 [Candidatus Uhrbacteria bacterium]|nr:hypothetical protein [Candidatus Uhrbacteria bacterium]